MNGYVRFTAASCFKILALCRKKSKGGSGGADTFFLNFGLWDGICLTSSTQIVVTYSSELQNTASTESTDIDFLLLNLGQENEISNYLKKSGQQYEPLEKVSKKGQT